MLRVLIIMFIGFEFDSADRAIGSAGSLRSRNAT
jgi:hypothetical protein